MIDKLKERVPHSSPALICLGSFFDDEKRRANNSSSTTKPAPTVQYSPLPFSSPRFIHVAADIHLDLRTRIVSEMRQRFLALGYGKAGMSSKLEHFGQLTYYFDGARACVSLRCETADTQVSLYSSCNGS